MQGLLNNHLNLRKAAILQAFGVNIVKSNMNDLSKANKGGEGSKGGKVIGHTKSGKPVYAHKDAHEYKDFNHQDHSDAHKLHMNHADKLKGTPAVNSRIRAHDHTDEAKFKKDDADVKSKLKQHLDKNEEHFYSVVSKHYQPSDDGESEHAMLENLSKHKDANKILAKLDKKGKKGKVNGILSGEQEDDNNEYTKKEMEEKIKKTNFPNKKDTKRK